MKIRTCLVGLLTSLFLTQPAPLQAATHFVGVDDLGFFPDALTIEQGDEVIWVNADVDDFPHTTTSTLPFSNPNYWNGFLPSLSDSFAKTFNNLGAFTYFDQAGPGTGTITVVAPAPAGLTLEAPRLQAGQFLFDATGLTAGKTNVLQTSTNLTTWTSLRTNVATSSTLTFTNAATAPARFFRLYEIQ